MCVPLAGMAAAGGLMEQLGDPLGTKKRRDDAAAKDQQNKWAREDMIRRETWDHEKSMAGMQGGSNRNRGSLGVQGGQGGNKSKYSSGTGSQSSKY